MPKKAIHLICNAKELSILNKLANEKKTNRLTGRAKIILYCHAGLRNDQVAKKLQTTVLTVAKWRNRFNKARIDGLKDNIRSGKPRKYDDSVRNTILNLIKNPASDEVTKWSGNLIARKLGISHDIVWRILRKEGIKL